VGGEHSQPTKIAEHDETPKAVSQRTDAESRGSPRRSWASRFTVLLVVCVAASSLAAYLVGRSFSSPAQDAARAAPPKPSRITAPVEFVKPVAGVVFRATLTDPSPLPIKAPTSLYGSLPVVTALPVRVGARVSNGTLLAAVADRPIIALRGAISAFRTIRYGLSGIDVKELQSALSSLGFSTGTDPAGTYGLGTAEAVLHLYQHLGYQPISSPVRVRTSRHTKTLMLATVPLGEAVFVPSLPRAVISVPSVFGESVPSAAGNSGTLVKLGSNYLVLRGSVDSATLQLLRVGMLGTAGAGLSESGIRVKVVSLGQPAGGTEKSGGLGGVQYSITLVPLDVQRADRLVGQSLAVRLKVGNGGRRRWVVPVAAVVTQADDRSVVVVVRHGRQIELPVVPGFVFGGHEVVTPIGWVFHTGDSVVVGTETG